MRRTVSRRIFLRQAALAAAGVLAAACRGSQPDPAVSPAPDATATPRPMPDPTEKPEPGLRLDTGFRSDVWAWETGISGALVGGLDCQSITLTVNDQPVEAAVTGDGFNTVIPIVTGENTVRASCAGSAGETQSRIVHFNGKLERRPCAQMKLNLDGNRLTLSGAESRDARGGTALSGFAWSARAANPASVLAAEGDGVPAAEFTGALASKHITVALPAADGEYYFDLTVTDAEDLTDHTANYVVVQGGVPRIPDYDTEHPAFVEKTVIYGVVPFLFGRPAWPVLSERMADLADLGVNALWLGPITQSPADDYGYAVLDYLALRTSYGGPESFRQMIETAHQHGIRVLMDFVPNHTSAQHDYYQDAQQRGPASRFYDFYDRDESGQATHYFNWEHLPNLNYDNPEVRRWMLEAFAYWVREFDIDGFRVDVAWGIKQRRPDFWLEWRRELKRIKPDLLLLAEASARDPYYFANGFDAAYDWTEQLGAWAWELVWDSYKHRQLAYNLEAALTNRPNGYDPDAVVMRFLNNNDTGDRFITRHGPAFTRVATALLLTLPGLPTLYTGDEVGAEYRPYDEGPPLTWEERMPGLRDYHKRLVHLRLSTPSLTSRDWQRLETAPLPQAVFSYLRTGGPADTPVIVVLNFSEEPAETGVALPAAYAALGHGEALFDLLTEQPVPIAPDGEFTRLTVPASTALVLTART